MWSLLHPEVRGGDSWALGASLPSPLQGSFSQRLAMEVTDAASSQQGTEPGAVYKKDQLAAKDPLTVPKAMLGAAQEVPEILRPKFQKTIREWYNVKG